MRYLPYWFEGLQPEQMNAHVRHLANKMSAGSRIEVEISSIGVHIPIIKREYKTKAPRLMVLIRTSDVGRPALNQLHSTLVAGNCKLWERRSAKKRILSQVGVLFSIDDNVFPLQCVSILRLVCESLGIAWPQQLAVGYTATELNRSLPGRLTSNDLGWRAAHAAGRAIGKALRKLRS